MATSQEKPFSVCTRQKLVISVCTRQKLVIRYQDNRQGYDWVLGKARVPVGEQPCCALAKSLLTLVYYRNRNLTWRFATPQYEN